MDPLKNHSFFWVKVTRASSGLCSIPRSAWHFLPRSLQVPRRKQCKSRSLELWKTQAVKAQMLNSAKWKIMPKEDWKMAAFVLIKPPKLSPNPLKKWRPPHGHFEVKKATNSEELLGPKFWVEKSSPRINDKIPLHVFAPQLAPQGATTPCLQFAGFQQGRSKLRFPSQGPCIKLPPPHFPLKPPPSSLV